MNRPATPGSAAAWPREGGFKAGDAPGVLDDPALAEAMTQVAAIGRLSDDDIRAMRRNRRRAVLTGVVAGLTLVAGIGGWKAGMFDAPAPAPLHFATQRGERLNVELADGSTLRLNGATSLDVTITPRTRVVEMRRGEAYFDIAHEAARPFIVHAAASTTRVLGTAFDLDVTAGDVRLAVYRGKVRFGGSAGAGRDVVVPAGWRSRFTGGRAVAPTRFDAAQPDWRQDWLDVDDLRLADLVEALNRRGGPLVETPPAPLGNLQLAGRFKIDNPRQLLDAIGAVYGFEVVDKGDRLRLAPASASDAKTSRN